MEKIILAILAGCLVVFTILFPFYLVIVGFIKVFAGKLLGGALCVFIGLILLRLIKPISIITQKDYKIF